jgi:hypothetical protein
VNSFTNPAQNVLKKFKGTKTNWNDEKRSELRNKTHMKATRALIDPGGIDRVLSEF